MAVINKSDCKSLRNVKMSASVQINIAIVEISLEISQKKKNQKLKLEFPCGELGVCPENSIFHTLDTCTHCPCSSIDSVRGLEPT